VKTFLLSTAFVAGLLVFGELAHEALSQQAGGAPTVPPTVAAIDIGKVFKNHNRLKGMQTQMKTDADAARADLQKEKERIQALMEKIKTFSPGTPDYKRLETDIVQAQAQLATRAKLQEKEFTEREARNYYTIYREINDEVKTFAETYKINIVLRYNSDPPDVNDPQSVLRDINKPIVHLASGLDITDIILQTINARSGMPAAGDGPARNTSPQQQAVPRPR
jgi:Skp family chaperone for outer membrane proteins